jgi:ubiquinone/menaquinone biosynthesis C-methylase UbiE
MMHVPHRIADGSRVDGEWKGRHRVIHDELLNDHGTKLSVDIGSKHIRQGDITIDIDRETKPDIVADVTRLPLRANTFDRAFMTDVIEHLPEGSERTALCETRRVLKCGGELILTTPNDCLVYGFLDPARHIIGHRHYKVDFIRNAVQESGFRIQMCFTRGGVWEMIWVLYYCFFSYTLGIAVPRWLRGRVDREYAKKRLNTNGYTIFIKASTCHA